MRASKQYFSEGGYLFLKAVQGDSYLDHTIFLELTIQELKQKKTINNNLFNHVIV